MEKSVSFAYQKTDMTACGYFIIMSRILLLHTCVFPTLLGVVKRNCGAHVCVCSNKDTGRAEALVFHSDELCICLHCQ